LTNKVKNSEKFKRHYEIIRRGYKLDKISERAATVCDVEKEDFFSKGKQKRGGELIARENNYQLMG
jgi:hypothetical protein